MPNKHISQPPTDLLRARLKVLLENVDTMYRSKTSVVEEDLVSAYSSAMDLFLKSLDGSIVSAVAKILKGSPANPFHYNIFTDSIARDLDAIYAEIGTLDKIVVGSFNSVIAEREQVLQISKRVSDKLGTYLLYADPSLGAGYFFGDSFNSAENVEVGSTLLDTEECFLGQDEGVVLLPLDGDPQRPRIKSYIVNNPSNGTAGNNFEIGVVGHNAIEAVGDGEPNTWFEYERVTAYESDVPLVLDITITLDQIVVINHININPINFGTPSPVYIATLETSKDGLEYISVKDEVPLKDFVSEDEENVFSLSPSTAKFSGQGFYSFLPRKAQFVHIVFEQHTPYAINTNNGTRLRYAIGLRDINILGRKFKPEGSLISKPFNIGAEARKVALFTSENPVEKSSLADVLHFISENDGATWRPIQPQDRSGFDIPEVIDYNTIAGTSIQTSIPVESLRHKIYMKREAKAFDGNAVLKEEKVQQVDIVNIPAGGDFSFSTTQKPIRDTVRVLLPFYGSFSCPRARYGSSIQGESAPMNLDMLEFNVDMPASGAEGSTDILRFDLPYNSFENLPEHIRVFYNGSQIEYCAKNEDALGKTAGIESYTSYTTVDGNSKVYFLDKGGKQLQFGFIDSDGVRCGFLPVGGSKIQVCLDGDNPRMELTDSGYVLILSGSSDGFKEYTSIVSMDKLTADEASDYEVELPAGRDKVKLSVPAKRRSAFRSTRRGSSLRRDRVGVLSPIMNVTATALIDGLEQTVDVTENSIVKEAESGALPPVFIEDLDTWRIVEYALDGTPYAIGDTILNDQKTFIDGRQELLTWTGSAWVDNIHAYSFDPYSGTVYTGSPPRSDRKTMFKCKILSATVVPPSSWEFYQHSITGRINSQKIVLDPKYVTTYVNIRTVQDYRDEIGLAVGAEMKSIQLLGVQAKGHDWFKQRLVKGTLKMDSTIFAAGSRPTEVPFIDGDSELYSVILVQDEPITLTNTTGYLYEGYLQQITDTQIICGEPGFGGIRSITSAEAPPNYFITYVDGTPAAHGEWTYTIESSGECRITIYIGPTGDASAPHAATYKYRVLDAGVDISGLYSVDYTTSTIHFATPITANGNIQFEVSTYSAFYNIAEPVSDGDIKEIDEDGKKITMSTAFGMRFLKLGTALKARPAFAKLAYQYHKQSTESMKDLEPYFSPICKDLALRAVTSSTLEEL